MERRPFPRTLAPFVSTTTQNLKTNYHHLASGGRCRPKTLRLGMWLVCAFVHAMPFGVCCRGLNATEPVGLATIDLPHGGSIFGQVTTVDHPKRRYSMVELDDGLRVAISQGDIRRTATEDANRRYRELAAQVPDDAVAHFELARWCKQNSLHAQSKFHMRRVVQLDPDHGTARESLNYVKRGQEWVPRKQWERDRGIVRSAGRYHIPEDLAMQNAAKENATRSNHWGREIAKLRGLALRGGEKGGEAMQSLRAIDDPLAAAAIGDELTNPRNRKQPLPLRLLWVELLGRFRTPKAVEPLVWAGVRETDNVVREAALEKLEKYGAHSAVLTYVPMLKSQNNADVKNAGRALAFLPDPEIRFQLIDALITEHTTITTPATETNVGFSSSGAGGMSFGATPQKRTDHVRNPQVLAALRAIAPGADFGYDKDAWRRYFAEQLSSYSGDLRRD